MLSAIDTAIREIGQLNKKNSQRPVEGDLFCPPIKGFRPARTSSDKPQPSPLYWKREAIELKELLTALDVDGAFVNASGDKVSFSTVVKCFENFLNVELGSSREVKRLTFDRGERKSCTQYLDLLVTQMNKEKNRRK